LVIKQGEDKEQDQVALQKIEELNKQLEVNYYYYYNAITINTNHKQICPSLSISFFFFFLKNTSFKRKPMKIVSAFTKKHWPKRTSC
jgi:hypothetical protein